MKTALLKERNLSELRVKSRISFLEEVIFSMEADEKLSEDVGEAINAWRRALRVLLDLKRWIAVGDTPDEQTARQFTWTVREMVVSTLENLERVAAEWEKLSKQRRK